jgi:large subunit ribosomal protein L10
VAKFLKKLMADQVRDALDAAPQCLVVNLGEIDAEKDVALRSELRLKGARLRVVHNRTARHALDDRRKGLATLMTGQVALALPQEEDPDMVTLAKTLLAAQVAKTIQIRGGWVDGELLDREGVELLAKSPDKHTLRGMLAGAINGAARGLAVSLSGVGGGLARCLKQKIDKSGDTPSE